MIQCALMSSVVNIISQIYKHKIIYSVFSIIDISYIKIISRFLSIFPYNNFTSISINIIKPQQQNLLQLIRL